MGKVYDGIIGVAIGDALGVPVEFVSREDLAKSPVTGMMCYGTHNQPVGTWSDDTSLTLALMDSIVRKWTVNYHDIMDKFSEWLLYGTYTATEEVFDVGSATSRAIMNYGRGMNPLECGGMSEYENGNGSLMRILPVAYYMKKKSGILLNEQMDIVHNISSLTHRHPISLIGCGIYVNIALKLLSGGLLLKEGKYGKIVKNTYVSRSRGTGVVVRPAIRLGSNQMRLSVCRTHQLSLSNQPDQCYNLRIRRYSNMKVLMLNGSAKPEGNTYLALSEVGKQLEKEGISYEVFQLGGDAVRDCIGCGRCTENGCIFTDDRVNEFIAKAKEADGYVFGTPVYYAHPSGRVLSFLDRVFYSGGSSFAFKPAASVAVARRGGCSASFDVMNKYFGISQMPVAGSTYWNLAHGRVPGEVLQDAEGLQTMRNLARNLAWMLKCFEAGREKGILPPEAEREHRTHFIR